MNRYLIIMFNYYVMYRDENKAHVKMCVDTSEKSKNFQKISCFL